MGLGYGLKVFGLLLRSLGLRGEMLGLRGFSYGSGFGAHRTAGIGLTVFDIGGLGLLG